MRRLSSLRWLRALPATVTALAVLATLLVLAAASTGGGRSELENTAAASDPGGASGIRLVQANIKSGMAAGKTAADLGQVFAQVPDFITFNEVSSRPDALLAPPGYAIQRTPGTYTGATAVVWDTSRWTKIAAGTYNITDVWGKTKNQKVHWGVRYANWVTVRNPEGRVVSVVAVHFAPASKYTQGLTLPSYQRLAGLAQTLSASGPVLMAGDVNVNFRTAAYPRNEIAALGLVNVFDLFGVAPGTHDSGAVIDHAYLYQGDPLLPVTNLTTVPLHSDHHLLAVDLGNVGPRAGAFAPGWVSNKSDKKATMRLVKQAIKQAPPGSALHLATKKLSGNGIYKAIVKARARGVEVQIITGHGKATPLDRKLAKLLGTKKKHKSWAKRKSNWARTGLPRSLVLASMSGGTRAVRIDYNRAWVPKQQKKSGSAAQIRSDQFGYDEMFIRYFAAVGRTI
ncbi:endonuclease/exonuclease/phosphatase family protein [Nocardioides humi]|uniref:Endonuclease/exonuclease/phosphatase domain-containing protein n=1 Tax=Nocardioides humi TaxID=449461 RepID=A0ABN1ZP61_9ACTN|nr:endonuclease/exonuclease/phosphatase family protein [Nocardioides humi]